MGADIRRLVGLFVVVALVTGGVVYSLMTMAVEVERVGPDVRAVLVGPDECVGMDIGEAFAFGEGARYADVMERLPPESCPEVLYSDMVTRMVRVHVNTGGVCRSVELWFVGGVLRAKYLRP